MAQKKYISFGFTLDHIRLGYELSQEAFSELIGISRPELNKILNGISPPGHKVMQGLLSMKIINNSERRRLVEKYLEAKMHQLNYVDHEYKEPVVVICSRLS